MAFWLNATAFCLTLALLFLVHGWLEPTNTIRQQWRYRLGWWLLVTSATTTLIAAKLAHLF